MRTRIKCRLIPAAVLPLLFVDAVAAQEQGGETAETLPDITVSAPRLQRDIYATPAAISTLNQRQIRQGEQSIRLDESLGTVPGLYIQNRNNFAQGQLISIRGFGARSFFGIRGLHIRVDGIPYTLPDGQAQIDSVDLAGARQIEVIRGPSSVLYGNAAGGVIDITTTDGRYMRQSPVIGLQGGSDGLRQANIKAGGEQGDWHYYASGTALHFDGYRDQSEVEKYLLNSKLGYRLDNNRSVSSLLNLLDTPKAEDPGGLTREAAEEDPSQAWRFSRLLDAGQSVDQQLVGTHYRDEAFVGGALDVRAFYSWRDFEQQLPFPGSSLINYQRDYFGGGVEYTHATELAGRPVTWITGLDLGWQQDDRGRQSVDTDGNVTGITGDEYQQARSTGVFLQGEWLLTGPVALSAGVRYDRVVLEIDDYLVTDNSGDDSGERTFREWSGSVGLSYRYRPSHQLYTTVGNAFETPTFTEFARPDGGGGFNPDLEPQQAWNYEVGARGLFDNGVEYELALFSVNVEDELVPFESTDGRTFYRNAGRTSRDGLEAGIRWPFQSAWTATNSVTWARYRFDRFEEDGDALSGNELPGLPDVLWHGALAWQGLGGRFAEVGAHYEGDFYADNANTESVDSHWRFDVKAGDSWRLGADNSLDLYAGVRNLLDEDYFENVRINAFGGRYYEPAAGRTFYAGIELGF